MSFNIALTGLNAVSNQLGTISNNIANAGTTGFKSSRTDFGSVYAESRAMGVEVLGNTQSISRNGSLVATGRSLDLSIAGGGFFITKNSANELNYTRAGVFNTDRDNFITSANGQRLQGYPVAGVGGALQTGALSDLQLLASNLPARATDTLAFNANLDANQAVPANAFDTSDPDSFNHTYTSKVYDSLGREHTLTQYFVKTGENVWDMHYALDGGATTGPQAMTFDTSGNLTAPAGVNMSFTVPGAENLDIAVDYQGSSQYGSGFVVTRNLASGYSAGEQTGLSVERDGRIYATYSNGQRMLQGQLALASFVNEQGLRDESGTAWSESVESGAALIGVPGVGLYGAIASGTLENSNVDLTQELVGLMESQRNYQANSKVLSTDKELAQILFNAI